MFFFLFFICYKHRHLAWTILDSSPFSIHAPFILTPSLFLSNIVRPRRRNYKKISNHEQNGDKRPHVLHSFLLFCLLHIFFLYVCSFVRHFFFLTTHPFDLSNCHDHCFPQSLRVTNYTVTVFHYYRYITLRHYIFINSSRSLATIQQYHVKLVNLCLNRREIARCNSSGFKGKKRTHEKRTLCETGL